MTNNLFSKLTASRRRVADTLANPATIGLWNLIVDKYSGKAHFVYELLQNADDAGASDVRLVLRGDDFYFIHNGTRHFSVTDVETEDMDEKIGDINALCSIGHSTKIGENKIGKFGIGFKSIFSYCDVPHVEDDNFSFDIEDFIVPVESKRIESGRRGGETLFSGKIKSVPEFCGQPQKSEEIAAMVASLEYPLNYLNNVSSLVCDIDGKIYRFTKTIVSSKIINEECEIRDASSFIFFDLIATKNVETHGRACGDGRACDNGCACDDDFSCENVQKFRCASKSFLFGDKQMSATLSMPLDGDRNAGVGNAGVGNVVMCDSSALNCFFPLLEQTTLPFLVHGTFLLSDNRENTLQNEENNALRHEIASLSVSFLKYLKSWKTVERLLEMKDRCKYENVNSLNRLCSERLWNSIASDSFFADAEGRFMPTSDLNFCVENVAEILNDDDLKSLSEGSFCKDFVNADFSKLPFLAKILEPHFWGVETMLLSLDESFMTQKSEEWLMGFYRYLYEERKVVSKLLRGKSEAFTKPWIKCADGEFRSLKSNASNQMASLYLSGDASHSVFPPLLLDKEISALFTDIFHLTHFSEQALTVDFVAQQFHENSVSPFDYDTLSKYIMTAASEYVGAGFDFEKKKSIVGQFGNLPFLPTNKYTLELPTRVLAETVAQRIFFDGNSDAVFLPNEFIEKHIAPSDRQTFYTFISACGVCFDVRIDKQTLHHPIDYKQFGIAEDELPSPSKLKETEIDDCEIAGFDYFLQHPTLEKSLAFCRMLQSLLDKEISTEVMNSITANYRYTPKGKRNSVETTIKKSTAYRQLFQSRWLVKTTGEYASAGEIASTDMLKPAYDEIPYSVFSFLGIALKKRDENAESREALELIRALEKAGITKDDLKKMINDRIQKQ